MKFSWLLLMLAGVCCQGALVPVGFDAKDSTELIEQALSKHDGNTIVFKKQASPFLVSRTIKVPSNTVTRFEDGAELQAMPGKFEQPQEVLLSMRKVKNVKISGNGIISMHCKDYADKNKYKFGEWRHGIEIFASSNIEISDVLIQETGGDGLYVNYVTDVKIQNVKSLNNYRQGISIISGKNLLIKNCEFGNTDGTAPMAGIDFEPNHWSESFQNCRIEDCKVNNNNGYGLLMSLHYLTNRSLPLSITIKNCDFINNKRGAFIFNSKNPGVKGFVNIENCNFKDSTEYSFVANGIVQNGFSINLIDTKIDNNRSASRRIFELVSGYVNGTLGNIHFSNVEFLDSAATAEPFYFAGYELNRLAAIDGKIKFNGQEINTGKFVEKSAQYKVAECVIPDLKKLTPLQKVNSKPAAKADLLRVRFSGTFIQYAQAGEIVKVKVYLTKIGKNNNNGEVAVLNPDGKSIGKFKILLNQENIIEFKAESTGIYNLIYNTGFNGMSFVSENVGNGYLAFNPLQGNRCKVKMYFMVPAGVKQIGVRVSGDGAGETVWVRLKTLDGKVLSDKARIDKPELISFTRLDVSKAEIFELEIYNSNDDFNISLTGGATAVFSDSPDNLFK